MRIILALALLLAAGPVLAQTSSADPKGKPSPTSTKAGKASAKKADRKDAAAKSSGGAGPVGGGTTDSKTDTPASAAASSSISSSATAKDPKTEALEKEAAKARADSDRRMAERDRKLNRALKSICTGC